MEENYKEYLDSFEQRLENGLKKICTGASLLGEDYPSSADIDSKWADYVKEYIADAVENFTSFPDAAISWAAFLGMGVAHRWDRDWDLFKDEPYSNYYGSRGWDDMDEHICNDIIKLSDEEKKLIVSTLQSCAIAVTSYIRHEGIEAQTALGFYALARSYGAMFRLGAAIELKRLGYRYQAVQSR